MEILTVVFAVVFGVGAVAVLAFSLRPAGASKNPDSAGENFVDVLAEQKDEKKEDREIENLTVRLYQANAALSEQEKAIHEKYSSQIEELQDSAERLRKDSFDAELKIQELSKELAAQKSSYKILSLDYQALTEKAKNLDEAQQDAQARIQSETAGLEKTRESLERQYRDSLDACEKLKQEFEEFRRRAADTQENLQKKLQDEGFYKIGFERVSAENELLRKQIMELEEAQKKSAAEAEELNRKLDFAKETLKVEEQAQQDTVKLEELLEKQLLAQKKRAAELLSLEQENKTLKDQLEVLRKKLPGAS